MTTYKEKDVEDASHIEDPVSYAWIDLEKEVDDAYHYFSLWISPA